MFYSIRHSTKFRYTDLVRHSVMEVRMQPRSENHQSVRQFDLTIEPRVRVHSYRDFLGNLVHHFDVPGAHGALSILAQTLVEVEKPARLPKQLQPKSWDELAAQVEADDYWDFLMDSKFAHSSELLEKYERELDWRRRDDPLSLVRELNGRIFKDFQYASKVTRVDSPIDEALEARMGVCQDFTHIAIALLRRVCIPARYVSGYLYHGKRSVNRSVADATHAWFEVFLAPLGWVGFDPTNNLECSNRHIRTAVGRDYADVTPTRGIFRGKAREEMNVAVQVRPADAPRPEQTEPVIAAPWIITTDATFALTGDMEEMTHQQQ